MSADRWPGSHPANSVPAAPTEAVGLGTGSPRGTTTVRRARVVFENERTGSLDGQFIRLLLGNFRNGVVYFSFQSVIESIKNLTASNLFARFLSIIFHRPGFFLGKLNLPCYCIGGIG